MKVTATLQAPDNDPVDVVWSNDTNEIGAMLSVAQLFSHNGESTVGTKTLAITIEL